MTVKEFGQSVWAFGVTLLGLFGTILGILSFKSATSYPVLEGIDAYVCMSPFEEDVEKQKSLSKQLGFYNRALELNHQLVYVRDLRIQHYPPQGKPKKGEPLCTNELFELFANNLKSDGGTMEIGLPALAHSESIGLSDVILIVGKPTDSNAFSDDSCDEHCFGALGLYRVKVNLEEGFRTIRLDPFPASGTLIDAYQCTLDKLAAKTAWERFLACRF